MVIMLIGFAVFVVSGFGHIDWNAYPEALPNGFTQLLSAAALLTFATMGSFGVAELGGVNLLKWTHQCVLSGSNIHHRCIIDLEVNRCSIPQSRVPTPRVITN